MYAYACKVISIHACDFLSSKLVTEDISCKKASLNQANKPSYLSIRAQISKKEEVNDAKLSAMAKKD